MLETKFYYFVSLGILCGCMALIVSYVFSQTMLLMQDKVSPNTFKIHTKNTPRCGGIGIFIAFICVVMGGFEVSYSLFGTHATYLQQRYTEFYVFAGLHIYVACFFVMLGGVLKDSNKYVSSLTIASTQSIGFVYFIIAFFYAQGGLLNIFLIIACFCFLFFTTNSINLIDGIHGNAVFTTLLVLASLCYVGLQMNNNFILFVSSLLFGICIIFLCFNFPYGKMFLGDSGAFLLGFCIGALLILGIRYCDMNVWYALAVMIYPLCEVLTSIIVRLKNIKHFKFLDIVQHCIKPSNYHVHFFLYAIFKKKAALIINAVYAPFVVIATLYCNEHLILIVSSCIFCIFYAVGFYMFKARNQLLYT